MKKKKQLLIITSTGKGLNKKQTIEVVNSVLLMIGFLSFTAGFAMHAFIVWSDKVLAGG